MADDIATWESLEVKELVGGSIRYEERYANEYVARISEVGHDDYYLRVICEQFARRKKGEKRWQVLKKKRTFMLDKQQFGAIFAGEEGSFSLHVPCGDSCTLYPKDVAVPDWPEIQGGSP